MILAYKNRESVGLDIPGEMGVDFSFELGRMLIACLTVSDENWSITFNRLKRKAWDPRKDPADRAIEEWAFQKERRMFWSCIVWMVDQKVLIPWDARLSRFQVNQDLVRHLQEKI